MPSEYSFSTEVWEYEGTASWYFVTLPKGLSAEIRAVHADRKRGWGSLPVAVRIGDTRWNTSLFPSAKDKAYLLPLKADVRKKEGLREGSRPKVTIAIG